MPWKRVVTAILLMSLAFPAAALAGNGGVAPPPAETPSGDAIRDVYWVALAISAVVLVVVEVALVVFVVRFRRRPSTAPSAEGPQIHGNTRLEVAWTLVPAVILVGLAAFALVKATEVEASPSADENAVAIDVQGRQFYWQYVYPNGAVSLDRLYVPVNRSISLRLTGLDVVHSWWTPELTGKRDAIPGRVNTLNFKPRTIGTYEGKCGEHCGILHAKMATVTEVMSQEDFQSWLDENAPESIDPVDLGRREWAAVCAECHGENGEGGAVGPSIQGNGTILALESLRTLLLNGQNRPDLDGYMPPVGQGWQDFQFEALLAYIESNEQISSLPGAAGGTNGS